MSELRTYPCYRTRYADSVLMTRNQQSHKHTQHVPVAKPIRVIEVPQTARSQNLNALPSKRKP